MRRLLALWCALLLLASCAAGKTFYSDLTIPGKVVHSPSSPQTLAAGTAISANAAAVRITTDTGAPSPSKATNNTSTTINGIAGPAVAGDYTLRVTTDSSANHSYSYNGVAAPGNPFAPPPTGAQPTINGGASAGALTFTVVGGVGPNQDRTDTVSVTTNGPVTLTSAPTIADGTDGQLLAINVGDTSADITLQSESALTGSNLRLAGSTVVMSANETMYLVYSSSAGLWVQLGLSVADIGTAVQAYSAALASMSAITAAPDQFIVGQGGSWAGESGATARTSLGLGNVENTALSTWAGSTNLITGGSPFRVQKDQNAPTQIISRNDTSGTAGSAQVCASLGNFGQYLTAAAFSPLYTTNGLLQANGTALFSSGAIAGLAVVTLDNYPVYLGTNNTQRVKVDSTGLQVTGSISSTAGISGTTGTFTGTSGTQNASVTVTNHSGGAYGGLVLARGGQGANVDLSAAGRNSYIGALGGILSVGTSNVSGSDKLQVSGNAYVSGAITAASINVGEDTLDVYDEGSFTISTQTSTMFNTGYQSLTVYYVRVGKTVTLRFPSGLAPAGSASALFYDQGLPSGMRPPADFYFVSYGQDNGVGIASIGKIESGTGGIFFYPSAALGTWATSGNKGFDAFTLTYTLN